MSAMVWLPPLIRALATGLIVVTASAVAESAGPFWGALIASLPVSAGPAYVFLAMQHGPDFVAASALCSCAANAATGLFLIVYRVAAPRTSPWQALIAAVLAWFAAILAANGVAWTPLSASIANLIVYGAGFAVLDTVQDSNPPASHAARRRRRVDLLIRAVGVAGFVSLVVAVSSLLGPEATGIAAVFPISLISLIVIVRPRIGGSASGLLAANALRSMLGFGLMLLVLHLTIQSFGTAIGLCMALLVSGFWSAALLLPGRRTVPVGVPPDTGNRK